LEEPKNRPREEGTSERERATILSIERERLPVLHRYEEEEEEGEGREVWRNQKTEQETILSIKAAFPTSKGGFFFCNSVSYFG
jgi:hypothetical protein